MNEQKFLVGKVVASAAFETTKSGATVFVLRFTDGTAYGVGAWQNEGYPIEMELVERKA